MTNTGSNQAQAGSGPAWDAKRLGELADTYGTPLYVYDAAVVRLRIAAIGRYMPAAVQLFYSMKANPNTTLVRHIYNTGTLLEICSLPELRTAQAAGVSPAHMMYLGPGKTAGELGAVLEAGVGYLIAESKDELALIDRLAEKSGMHSVRIGIRLNPEAAAKGARLQMGGVPRQFGMDEETLHDVADAFSAWPRLRLAGIHIYHGTRILAADTISEHIRHTLRTARSLAESRGTPLDFVGVGGGLGVPYFDGEAELDLPLLGALIREEVEAFVQTYPHTSIFLESGRYVTAESGVYLCRVLNTKVSKRVPFAIVDGGTHHHMAAGGSGNALRKNFPIAAFVPDAQERDEISYHLAGPLCTPNDVVAKHVRLPRLRPGDLVGILKSGAYGLTASPVLFLSHRLPREVLIDGEAHQVIRETDEYMVPRLRGELLLKRFGGGDAP